ncbi:MAG TPA: methyltransferase domain-containing protein [Thermomicrobiales bacterium]|nr:methyltransferase domain-containing protein [Thermomicrobiales bacterium]
MSKLDTTNSIQSRSSSLIVLPRTVAGRVAGMVAARSEAELYRRSIGLLGLQLEDAMLEVGCGAGVGIEQAAEIAALGKVCGIETSEALLSAARVRNADAIEGGYVELRQGLASRLPWPDATFDKTLAVNSPRDWPQPVVNLSEVRRVMRPGGKLAVVVQPPWRTAREGVRDLGELWAHRVDEAGFHDVRFGIISVGRRSAAAMTGTA